MKNREKTLKILKEKILELEKIQSELFEILSSDNNLNDYSVSVLETVAFDLGVLIYDIEKIY